MFEIAKMADEITRMFIKEQKILNRWSRIKYYSIYFIINYVMCKSVYEMNLALSEFFYQLFKCLEKYDTSCVETKNRPE